METSAQLWRAVWPRFGRVFAIELVLALAVIAAAWTALSAAAAPAIYKARFTEVWVVMLPGRVEVTERVALGTSAGVAAVDDKRQLTAGVWQRIDGTSVVLSGAFPGHSAYEISFAPAVAPEGAVALWKCSRTSLSAHWMPSQCRPARGA